MYVQKNKRWRAQRKCNPKAKELGVSKLETKEANTARAKDRDINGC